MVSVVGRIGGVFSSASSLTISEVVVPGVSLRVLRIAARAAYRGSLCQVFCFAYYVSEVIVLV